MSTFDDMKKKADAVVDKAKAAASGLADRHGNTVAETVDKITDAIDEKTRGSASAVTATVDEAVSGAIGVAQATTDTVAQKTTEATHALKDAVSKKADDR